MKINKALILEIKNGLPSSNLGKIGLAISPFDSSILYAASVGIEDVKDLIDDLEQAIG